RRRDGLRDDAPRRVLRLRALDGGARAPRGAGRGAARGATRAASRWPRALHGAALLARARGPARLLPLHALRPALPLRARRLRGDRGRTALGLLGDLRERARLPPPALPPRARARARRILRRRRQRAGPAPRPPAGAGPALRVDAPRRRAPPARRRLSGCDAGV